MPPATPSPDVCARLDARTVEVAVIFVMVILVAGCGVAGVFAGPDDYAHHHDADDTICIFSASIAREAKGENPNGWLTEPPDEAHWVEYWDHIVFYNVVEPGPTNPDRRGPTNEEILQWVVVERRERGLPDFPHMPQSGDAALGLEPGSAAGHAAVEARLASRPRHCWSGPAAAD